MMQRRVVLTLSLLSLVFAACGNEDNPLTNSYELSGRVFEESTGKGISGAEVRFTSETLYESSTTTDKDGKYEMSVETDSPFGQVEASKGGWRTASRTVYFDRDQRRMDIPLRPAPTP